jgi:hypothetical protein
MELLQQQMMAKKKLEFVRNKNFLNFQPISEEGRPQNRKKAAHCHTAEDEREAPQFQSKKIVLSQEDAPPRKNKEDNG